MLPYCSSGSQATKLESFVRYCLLARLRGVVRASLGKGLGVNDLGVKGSLATGEQGRDEEGGRGSLEGLSDRAPETGVWGSNDRFDSLSASESIEMVRIRLAHVFMVVDGSLTGETFRTRCFVGLNAFPFVARDGAGVILGLWERDIIRLPLGTSATPGWVPCAVSNRDSALLVVRSLARDDFGRARLDVDREAANRVGLPRLAEKLEEMDEAEVSLEAFDWVR